MLDAYILLLSLGMGHQQLSKQLLDERDPNTVEGSLFQHTHKIIFIYLFKIATCHVHIHHDHTCIPCGNHILAHVKIK